MAENKRLFSISKTLISPGRKKTGSPESGHLKFPGQPELDVMSG